MNFYRVRNRSYPNLRISSWSNKLICKLTWVISVFALWSTYVVFSYKLSENNTMTIINLLTSQIQQWSHWSTYYFSPIMAATYFSLKILRFSCFILSLISCMVNRLHYHFLSFAFIFRTVTALHLPFKNCLWVLLFFAF